MKRRVIITGASDAAKDVLAARAMLVENPLLEDDFKPMAIGIDANADDFLVDKGFRQDDVLVLMLGNQYGDVVSEGKSLEELLFELASDAGIQRQVFVKATNYTLPRQKEFLERISCSVVQARYRSTGDVVRSLFASLCNLKVDPIEISKEETGLVGNGLSAAKVCGAIAGGLACATGIGLIGSLLLAGVGAAVGAIANSDNSEDKKKKKKKIRTTLDAKDQDIHRRVDPKGVGETFKFKVTMKDIDLQRLTPFVEAENWYLGLENKPPLKPLDYLIKRNWADAEGRIYDSAFAAFGKIAAPATPFVPPRLEKPELTEKDAAEMIGITERQLRNWERGKNIPAGYPGYQNEAKLLKWLGGVYPKYGKDFIERQHQAMMAKGLRGRPVSYNERLADHQKPLQSGNR